MDSEDAIQRQFMAGELLIIDAIERLKNLGRLPLDAESQVEEWEDKRLVREWEEKRRRSR